MAARVAERRGAREAIGVLEEAARRSASDAGVADGSAKACRPELSRREGIISSLVGSHARAKGIGPARRRDAVYVVVGGLSGAAAPLQRAGGYQRRLGDRQSEPGGDRRADRLFRQYAGAPDRPRRRPELPRAAQPGARGSLECLRTSRLAVRAIGGSTAART